MENDVETFHLWLQDNGFVPDQTRTLWTGSMAVEWENADAGIRERAEHQITIYLPEGFPYHAPIVTVRDDPPLSPSWHLNPGDPPSLCLWDSATGWQPDFTAHKLLNRITDWFYCYHTDTWPANSLVPDLHLYLQNIGTVIIGEDWQPEADAQYGRFRLWHSTRGHSRLHIASSNEAKNEPEQRLRDSLFGSQRLTDVRGVWFRIPKPIVPLPRLSDIFQQLDALLQKSNGWSQAQCVTAVGQKARGEGFPIAIGYPDHLGMERWLFLWNQFPERKGKRFKWTPDYKLRQIKVNSYQTAPASKDDLFRRSAYISQSLVPRRVAVFGVGALGGSIALLLAKAGVGELILIDSDHLMPGNVMRHICGFRYVGFDKGSCVKLTIKNHNPDCYVEHFEATWKEVELRDRIKECDLVVDVTGNTNFSLHLNRICVQLNQPIMFAATYRRARVGKVIMRLDENSPCLACYVDNENVWLDEDYPPIPASSDEGFIEDGCGSVTEEAVALDVEAVANFTTRQIIKVLQGNHDGTNLAIVVNEPLSDTENTIFHTPGHYFWTNEIYSNCSVCRT